MTATVKKSLRGDARITSVHGLLNGRRLLAGDGAGVLRVPAIARILGIPLAERGALIAWLNDRGLITAPDYTGPLQDHPTAGTVEVEALRRELLAAMAGDGLPFSAVHLAAVR